MKRRLAGLMALCLIMAGCGSPISETVPEAVSESGTDSAVTEAAVTETESGTSADTALSDSTAAAQAVSRPVMLDGIFGDEEEITPTASYQMWEDDLSNVYFGEFEGDFDTNQWVDYSGRRELLAKNGFVLYSGGYDEFFELYETNRYRVRANFVTVDSMMHTYHLYFAHLLRKTEENKLCDRAAELSRVMLDKAKAQYDTLVGTEWENAARENLAFFATGCALCDENTVVPDAVSDMVSAELAQINAGEGIGFSHIFPDVMEDYSQYKPRGYYDSTEQLKKYFTSMMWYGRIGFRLDEEDSARSAVLMTLALEGDALDMWSEIYSVTTFFSGAADNIGYYEMRALIDDVYGAGADLTAVVENGDKWQQTMERCSTLPAPQINSVPVWAADSDEEQAAANSGFRFMGQRFSVDEAVFTQLVYRQVEENEELPEDRQKRMLPDVLDVSAAFGSEKALEILKEQGSTDYPNFGEQMSKVRETVSTADTDTWESSLYSAWLYTLKPVIEEKGESYPPFMRSDAWQRKALMTFSGSYAELKHDNILYSKQVMAEMGGAGVPEADDRGYVEPEPLVFGRLEKLVNATSEGLDRYGLLDEGDREELEILAQLAGKLRTIAVKELTGELPTDEEFDLIRSYGGQLEHFWQKVMDDEYPDEEYHDAREHPAAVIADIATDPDAGLCLEVGTGQPMEIYVIVEVDGQLKVASGMTYSFYEFSQPVSDRLTDDEWYVKLGIMPVSDGEWDFRYEKDESITYPKWYEDLIYFLKFDD